MKPGEIIIHRLHPCADTLPSARSVLTKEELARAARFRFAAHADTWITWRAGLRRILANQLDIRPEQVPIRISQHGKPLLAAPYDHLHFNLSHGPDLALVALSEGGPVGVDLEPLTRSTELLDCIHAFCHPREIAMLPVESPARCSHLLRIWAAKEAILKALGTGLNHPPEALFVDFQSATATSELPLPGIEAVHLVEFSPHLTLPFQAAVASTQRIQNLCIL